MSEKNFDTPGGVGYSFTMKSIQVRFDEDLLTRLDESEEVRRLGRSKVLQRVTAEYLGYRCQDCQSSEEIAAQYRKAYGRDAGLGAEFEGWENQGSWPIELKWASKD